MGKENLRGFGRLTNSWNHGWCSLNQKRTSIYIYGTSNWCSDHSKLWHKLLHVPKFMTHDSPKCWNQEIKQRTFIIIIISRLVLDSYLVTILGGKMSATAPPKTLLFLVIIIIIVIVIAIVIVMACRHIPTMTKSHLGGNMSVLIKVGMCQCQNPTIHSSTWPIWQW